MQSLQAYSNYLPARYSNYPRGYYVSLILLRKVEGEAIFRTEGSGEPLNREFVHAGIGDSTPVIPRVVISKRKQTAVERRTGRELLRRIGLIDADDGLNEGNPNTDNIDSMLYGFAVTKGNNGGAQKSRVITDDAFTILPATQVIGKRQFNGPSEAGTMRSLKDESSLTNLGTDEYVRPETHFVDIETLKDVTPGEFAYVLGNILRTSRYGAISSRVGKINNEVVACIFSDCELFSNLELTQHTWDLLPKNGDTPDFPLGDESVRAAILKAVANLQTRVVGRVNVMSGNDLEALLTEAQTLYANEESIKTLLTEVQTAYKSK